MNTIVSSTPSTADDSQSRLDRLDGIAAQLLDRCRQRGATQAEVSCSEEHGLNVNVRMGEVETVERTRDRGVALTVYFGQRKASASTADLQPESLMATSAWLAPRLRQPEHLGRQVLQAPRVLHPFARSHQLVHWPILCAIGADG